MGYDDVSLTHYERCQDKKVEFNDNIAWIAAYGDYAERQTPPCVTDRREIKEAKQVTVWI